jgi:hypothetical protein
VYIGNSIHGQQTTISYKNKKRVRKPEEFWYRVENTHEPLVSKEVFDQVQAQIAQRRRKMKNAETQIIVLCSVREIAAALLIPPFCGGLFLRQRLFFPMFGGCNDDIR